MPVELKLPQFIIAGAPRSGTTWLCSLLARHPQIGLAQPIAPEPKFFLVDDLYARGLAYYSERWFAGLDQEILGEKSTNYLENAVCAERIAKDLPDVKLIFVLRNPVDRAFSNYRWSRMNGHERLDFAQALQTEGRPLAATLRYAKPFDYLARGCYADLLAPYRQRFDASNMLLLKFEEICAAPETAAEKLHDFLGAERRPGDGHDLPPVNQAESQELDDASRRWLLRYYEEPNQKLQALTGLDVSSWNAA